MHKAANTRAIRQAVWALGIVLALSAHIAFAETILSPRSRAESEAERKLLEEKYAPKLDPKLAEQLAESDGVIVTTGNTPVANNDNLPAARHTAPIVEFHQAKAQQQAERAAAATPALQTGSKLRVDLIAQANGQFLFNGQSYTREELAPVLVSLGQQYRLDHIVLLQSGSEPISLIAQVELSKLSAQLNTPAMYQSGNQLRAVDAVK